MLPDSDMLLAIQPPTFYFMTLVYMSMLVTWIIPLFTAAIIMMLIAGKCRSSPFLYCTSSVALLLISPGQCQLSKQCVHSHSCQHMVCYCRLGNLEEVCAFASPASHGAAGKFGFTPMSAHFRPLMGHDAAQVVMTMQTLPEKATVVIGMLLLLVIPRFTILCMPQVACIGDMMACVLLPELCFVNRGVIA